MRAKASLTSTARFNFPPCLLCLLEDLRSVSYQPVRALVCCTRSPARNIVGGIPPFALAVSAFHFSFCVFPKQRDLDWTRVGDAGLWLWFCSVCAHDAWACDTARGARVARRSSTRTSSPWRGDSWRRLLKPPQARSCKLITMMMPSCGDEGMTMTMTNDK
eukprot:1140042-Rhodomonas_salina.1